MLTFLKKLFNLFNVTEHKSDLESNSTSYSIDNNIHLAAQVMKDNVKCKEEVLISIPEPIKDVVPVKKRSRKSSSTSKKKSTRN